jgi:type VI protein secretion system component Hcp
MLPRSEEVSAMPVKKNSSNAKKANKVAVKRHAKLVAPKGEKVSSMKGSSFQITKPIDVASPKLF